MDYWTRCGFLRPVQRCSNRAGNGTGFGRQWSEYELAIALQMGMLVRAGLSPELAHRVARTGKAGIVLAVAATEAARVEKVSVRA